MGVFEKLQKIQAEMKAPKSLYNSFGKYHYRNAENILEAFKPFGETHKVALTLSDEVVCIGERVYIKAIATLTDCESGEKVINTAFARESAEKKGMDDSQITGTASSYARKYALNGLFLLDDTKDADTDEYHKQTNQEPPKEEAKKIEDIGKMPISKIKVDSLHTKCKNDKVDEQKILDLYKVNSFEELTETKYSNIVNNWEKVKNA